jgi:hypothetical protein
LGHPRPALNEESLNRYVAGIQNLNPGRFTLLNSQTRFAPIQGSGFLLGKPYKMVHYRLVSEDDPTVVTEIRDFITQNDDTLIILSFECPQNLASRTSGSALTMLASLSSLDDLE